MDTLLRNSSEARADASTDLYSSPHSETLLKRKMIHARMNTTKAILPKEIKSLWI